MVHVSLSFKKSHHINQYLYGFMMLHKKGMLHIDSIDKNDRYSDKILRATIDGVNFIYDGHDGDQIDRGFFSLMDYEWCDVYYKRSYSPQLGHLYEKCKPIGFNYNIIPDYSKIDWLNNSFKRFVGKGIIRHSDLECLPKPFKKPRILFLTGLWDPCEDLSTAEEIDNINKTRLLILDTLSNKYKKIATFGVGETPFTRKIASKYIIHQKMVKRANFIKAIKEHDICITSNGLHFSTGWRFAEYISASRAIISEELKYSSVGNFNKNINYLPFSCEETLESSIEELLDIKRRKSVMLNNYIYYHNSLRPDSLILNSIVNTCL
ncbi:hypothetical protein WN53_14125 [Serratia fonticola]|uniref:hypothetical protein n=1 Tax=Serratia fonticola TaxID=47917 RepID=UPI00040FF18C|nr:hypothetical protein [Serratia fonticola]AKG70144.1 hypothetical protein WN53_14125 [Serratia fonticola]CAI1184697.1 Uncharacterised protein [Serratia fonticola]CAI1939519.1 Uncharacterised protein [Serratia fonticola]